jgi:hypothetical protein
MVGRQRLRSSGRLSWLTFLHVRRADPSPPVPLSPRTNSHLDLATRDPTLATGCQVRRSVSGPPSPLGDAAAVTSVPIRGERGTGGEGLLTDAVDRFTPRHPSGAPRHPSGAPGCATLCPTGGLKRNARTANEDSERVQGSRDPARNNPPPRPARVAARCARRGRGSGHHRTQGVTP